MPTQQEIQAELARRQSAAPRGGPSPQDINAELARRQGTQTGLGSVPAAVQQPALPTQKIPGFELPPTPGSGDPLQQQNEFALALDNTVRSVADLFSAGFADEAAATANAALGQGDFESNLAEERARDIAITPGERAAGFVGALAAPAGPAAQLIQRGATTLGRLGRSAVVGGTAGGLAGAGSAPEGERLGGALSGAGLGAALGPVGLAAAPVVGATGRGLAAIGRSLPTRSKAIRTVQEAFGRDEIGIEQAQRKLRQLGPDAILADVGRENVQSTLAASANLPGTAKRRASRVLDTRVRQQSRRVREAVQDGISDQDFDRTVTGTIQRRSETAGPLYDAARASGIVDNAKLDRLMRLPSVTAAITRVRGRNPDLLDLPDNDMRVLDAVYKDLGGQKNAAVRAGEKGSGSLANDLGKRQSDLLDSIAEDVPVYRNAVRTFSDESALLDAAELGRKFMREDAEVTARTLKSFSEAEREMFLTGATKAATDLIETTPNAANATRKLFGNERKRKQLRSLFPTKKAFDEFKLTMLAEQRFTETRNAVIPGSRTTPLAASVLDQGKSASREVGEAVAEAAVTGDLSGGFVRRGAGRVLRRFFEGGQPSEEMRSEIARLLTTQGVEPNQQILEEVFERALEDALSRSR